MYVRVLGWGLGFVFGVWVLWCGVYSLVVSHYRAALLHDGFLARNRQCEPDANPTHS